MAVLELLHRDLGPCWVSGFSVCIFFSSAFCTDGCTWTPNNVKVCNGFKVMISSYYCKKIFPIFHILNLRTGTVCLDPSLYPTIVVEQAHLALPHCKLHKCVLSTCHVPLSSWHFACAAFLLYLLKKTGGAGCLLTFCDAQIKVIVVRDCEYLCNN